MKIKITSKRGSMRKRTFVFDDPTVISLGRHPSNHVQLDPDTESRVSTCHCEIRLRGGAPYLEDLGSRNGTYVDGKRMARARLKNGSVVELGKRGPRFVVQWDRTNGVAPTDRLTDASSEGPFRQGIGLATLENRLDGVRREYRRKLRGPLTVVGAGMLATFAVLAFLWQSGQDTTLHAGHAASAAASLSARLEAQASDVEGKLSEHGETLQAHGASLAAHEQDLATQGDELDAVGARAPAWASVAAAAGPALVHLSWNGGSATAFAIDADYGLLGTTGSVSQAVRAAMAQGRPVEARVNGKPRHRYRVVRAHTHPAYRAEDPTSPDAGLLMVDLEVGGEALALPGRLQAAAERTLAAVKAGDPVALFGFPSAYRERYSRPETTVAKLVMGHVSSTQSFRGTPEGGAGFERLEHSCAAAPGSAGSPILDGEGHVVAIHNATKSYALAEKTRDLGEVRRDVPAGAIRGAVNVRFLQELVKRHFGTRVWGSPPAVDHHHGS